MQNAPENYTGTVSSPKGTIMSAAFWSEHMLSTRSAACGCGTEINIMILIDSVDEAVSQPVKQDERLDSRRSESYSGWYVAEYLYARDYHRSLVQAAHAGRVLAQDSSSIQRQSSHALADGLVRLMRIMAGWL